MKFLLDTHLLLWAAESFERLPEKARFLMSNPLSELIFSPASLWEIAIKSALGRPGFKVDPHVLRRGLYENGYTELPITSEHTLTIGVLPTLHKDPFDRILVAQAISEGITLLTADSLVAQYPGPIQIV
jgi:PIN domain nuclease of toxin-antitoxin system